MDRLQTIQIFVRVAQAGSFTRAAGALQLPRSTVSAAVQALEARLRTRLINRTTRKMHLTPDGASYLDWCQRMLAEIDETEQQFRLGQSQVKGKLRVDVPGRIARRVIAPALPEFFARYPEIELVLGATDRPVDLVHEGVDCAIRVGAVPDAYLVARPIGPLRLGSFASPAYLAEHGVPHAVADLARHVAIGYASPGSGRVAPWEYTEDGHGRTLPMRSVVTVNCVETYIACCVAGLGLIQIPAYDAREHVARGELVEVLPHIAPAPLPLSAIYPERRYTSRRVAAFIDWAGELYRQRMAD